MKQFYKALFCATILVPTTGAFSEPVQDRMQELLGPAEVVGLEAPMSRHQNMERYAERLLAPAFKMVRADRLENYKNGTAQDIQNALTSDAMKDMITVLDKLGFLKDIEKNGMMIDARQAYASKLLESKVIDGVYTWDIDVALTFQPYTLGSRGEKNSVNLQVKYVRTDDPKFAKFGAAISSIALRGQGQASAVKTASTAANTQAPAPQKAVAKAVATKPAVKAPPYLTTQATTQATSQASGPGLDTIQPRHNTMDRHATRWGVRPFNGISGATLAKFKNGEARGVTKSTVSSQALKDIVTVLVDLGWLDDVENNGMRVRAQEASVGAIVDQKVIGGIYTWTVEVPVNFQPALHGQQIPTKAVTLTMQVERTNDPQYRQFGVVINRIALKK